MTPDPLLLAAIRSVARSADPDDTLHELLEIGLRATGADRAAAFLWDASRGALAIAGSRGYSDDALTELEDQVTAEDHVVQLAAQERIRTSSETAGGAMLAAWPVVVGRDGIEEPIGAIAFEGDTGPDADLEERVAALADLVAVIVDRARLAENAAERIDWAERVGNSDGLTGLANARSIGRVLEFEIARAARAQAELAVVVFDVDDLTAFNDANGKPAGDDVLREVAAVLSESVRYVDTVARWGGDEFLLVAPGAKGTTVVERIVRAIAARAIGDDRHVTASAGIARFPADGSTSDELIQAATSALQAAQAAGPGTIAEATRDASEAPAEGSAEA